MLHVPFLLIFLLVSLVCGRDQDINCTVTQDGGQTLYSVPEFNATDCPYQWLNSSRNVMANQQGKLDVVKTNTNRTLGIPECQKLIYYQRTCTSEGIQRMAICYTDCSGMLIGGGPSQQDWIIPVVVAVVLLVVVLVVVLCCCRRQNRGCFYSAVKTEDNVNDLV